jgi:Rrf2 family protein
MEVLRRNTDYGLRAMVYLSTYYNERLVSVKELSREGHFSYQLGCKLLQKLQKAKLVKSSMGRNGGFQLSRRPAEITLSEIIKVLQGGIRLNKCLLDGDGCEFVADCEVHTKLQCLQLYIDGYLGTITLDEILQNRNKIKTIKDNTGKGKNDGTQ